MKIQAAGSFAVRSVASVGAVPSAAWVVASAVVLAVEQSVESTVERADAFAAEQPVV